MMSAIVRKPCRFASRRQKSSPPWPSTLGIRFLHHLFAEVHADQVVLKNIVVKHVLGSFTEVDDPLGHRRRTNRICTSHIERQNLTMRMQMRRFTRLTNAFSKKLENLKAACALHFAHYNFCRVHSSLRVTPAMAAGVSSNVWHLSQLLPEA